MITVSSMLACYSSWPGLAQVFQRTRTVIDGLGRQTQEVRYGVTSLPADCAAAQRVLAIARAAWGIENGLHYRRDVPVHEDASLLRRGHGPQVLATLNNGVIAIRRQHGERNLAALQRRFMRRFDQAINRLGVG